MIIIPVLYIKCFFYWIFCIPSRERDCFLSLYKNHTFRVPTTLKKDRLIGLRYLKYAILSLKYKNSEQFPTEQVLIFDGDVRQRKQRLAYLDEIYKREKKTYTALQELPGAPFHILICYLITMFPLMLSLIIGSFFSKNRASIALSMLSITQNFLLLRYILKHKIKKVYYFFSFENDANFNALVLMHKGVEVINVPGPNPLHRFHTHTVATKIALCTGFQFEQAEKLKERWFINDVLRWPLYGFQEFKDYCNNNSKEKKYLIGFISSGIWRRRELGLQSLENDYESESELIHWIKEYIENYHIKQLFIYLHPIEKPNIEIYHKALSFYKSVFKDVLIEFSSFESKSYQDFHKVNIALSSHSTTNLQRLYCGYKVFYTPMKCKIPLFPDTTIDSICITNKHELYAHINEGLLISDEEYFEKYQLWNYHYSSINENI